KAYDNQVTGAFDADSADASPDGMTRQENNYNAVKETQSVNKSNLIIFGREIMKHGSEVGLHGYNHQPLVFGSYTGFDAELGYNAWPSEEDAERALVNIRDSFAQVFADYQMMSYVPPSNLLSEEGRQVLKSVFPQLRVISGVYYESATSENIYLQEFTKGSDGMYDIPRVSDGYYITKNMNWNILNALNSIGVFSHFTHPDNAFYEDAIMEMGWKKVFKDFEEYMIDLKTNFSWLRTVTATQSTVYVEDFINLDYRVYEDGPEMVIDCWGFQEDVFFILRTPKKIIAITGAEAELIDTNAWILKISANQVKITFESGR
ncbi:MAG: DUF2194 domain-containing protein, partial [Sporomusaceae bacterium]|nr:DUF2194 domain-containing protein [Sporomusaceae bacterium]